MASHTRVGLALPLASLLSLLLPLSGVAGAQQPGGMIAGVVRDSAGKAIAAVDIGVIGTTRFARSDTSGAFRIVGMRAGRVSLAFRRFGFEPETVTTTLSDGRVARITVVLQPFVQDLPGMVVSEQDLRAREMLRGFYSRKERGDGFFITRAQIEQRGPLQLSDMLRSMPGAVLEPVSGSGRAVLRFARASMPGHDCPPQYYVDGTMASGLNIDDLSPQDIEGIEVYSGVSEVPPQFNNSRIGTSICGVVVVWTRVPGT